MIEGEQLTSGNTRYNVFEPSPVLHTINDDDSERRRRRKTHDDDIKQLTDKYEVIYKEMNVQRKNPGKWQILFINTLGKNEALITTDGKASIPELLGP
jgi:hypothetical protein